MTDATHDLLVLVGDRDDPEAVARLLEAGADPHRDDGASYPSTPLLDAVRFDRLHSVERMLALGSGLGPRVERMPGPGPRVRDLIRAQPFRLVTYLAAFWMWLGSRRAFQPPEDALTLVYSPESECASAAMARLLVRHGADPMLFDAEFRPAATGADLIPDQRITPELFQRHAAPRFGTANPEPCDNPFYLDQIRTGRSGYAAGRAILGDGHEPFRGAPVWSFARFGQSATRLPDGRLVLIAGEHEDHYDPDFHIYNDVTVLDGRGGVAHFLYPEAVFPPTDFHSATLLGDHILLIGALGYAHARRPGETQVLRVWLDDFRIEPVVTSGDNPGWCHRHTAELRGDEIVLSGGKVEPGYRDLEGAFALRLADMVWRRIA